MPEKPKSNMPDDGQDSVEYTQVPDTIPESQPSPKDDTPGEFLFQIFCAVIFLGMIGLVFYNAMLRYVFSSSYPPSEEWARFLFMYITFFGSIEAFYRKKHIAVDMFVDLLQGVSRKAIDVIAILLGMFVMVLLLWGGIENVMESYNTYSVATNVNMTFIYSPLPIMAAAALFIQFRDLMKAIKKPASEYRKG